MPDFIRGFTNSGGHSAINLDGSGGTIDSNGFRVKVATGSSVFSSVSDAGPTDGQSGTVLTIKADATLLNDTDKVTLQTQVGDGVNHYPKSGNEVLQKATKGTKAWIYGEWNTHLNGDPRRDLDHSEIRIFVLFVTFC